MFKYNGINHVALATNDMDTTIRFWRDLLGMKLLSGIGEKGNRQYFFELSENVLISFFEWPEVTPVPDKDPGSPVKGPLSLDHLAIEVNDEEELWKVKERLEAANFWVSEVIDNGFIHSIFSTDPNNIQLEFCSRVERIKMDELKMVDSHPTPAALEGPEPQTDKWPPVKNPIPPDERKIYPGELKKMLGDKK
jgi:catechol 2,3-dioxygenase-like lactoylglutathione lyase family enzyme